MSIVNFRIKDSEKNVQNPRDNVNVRVRIDKFEISTGLKVNRKHWSSSKQRVKNSIEADYADRINISLENLKTFLTNQYTLSKTEDIIITQKWLSDTINSFFNRATSIQDNSQIYLEDRFELYIEQKKIDINPRTGKTRSKRTIQDYENKLNKLKLYQSSINKKLKLVELDLNFHRAFINYLKKEHYITNNNTLKGYTDIIKQVIRDADRDGLKVSKDYEKTDFYTPSQITYDFAFKIEEVNKIYNHKFQPFSKLDKARDWLIIGIWTGLRISDFLKLEDCHIEDGYIINKNQKTRIPVIIPIHENVHEIIKKWNGKFPDSLSDQKFNEYIKEVGKVVGITEEIEGAKMINIGNDKNGKPIYRKKVGTYPKYELITSHVCRRSFASYHYGKIDTMTIMKITGHKTEKQFLDYVKIPSVEYAMRLKELWKNQTNFWSHLNTTN